MLVEINPVGTSTPRHEMTGIQAVVCDIDKIRQRLNNPDAFRHLPHNKRLRLITTLHRLYNRQEGFAQTGK